VDALVSGRPYTAVTHLLAEASELASQWTSEDVLRAVSRHPRIGERAAGAGAEAATSAREQSGVVMDEAARTRLEDGNAAYEKRFGHVFLIRAAGRSEDDVLAALELRLGNDPETEIAVVADELRQIALLRLTAMVGP